MSEPNDQDKHSSRLRSVVAATDFSPCSAVAVSWAKTMARAHRVPLQLVHAVTRTLPLLSRHDALSPLAEVSIGEADLRLEQVAEALRSPDQPVDHHLLHDRPSVSILKIAEWARAGLIVLGTRGEGGVHQLMLGSTAERVVERAVCPVLSVGPGSRPPPSLPRRILIATDFSIEADAAAIVAQELCGAGRHEIEILLLTVLHTPAGLESDLTLNKLWWSYVSECRTLLRERLAILSRTFETETSPVQALLREGLPAEEIVRVANQEEVDLIALGSRGPFAAGRGFLGSVSKRVIQTAGCPVLTVPSLLSKRMRDPARGW